MTTAVSELAIDLGTANTLVYADGRQIVDAPSVVALDPDRRVVAVGQPAKAMLGRAPKGLRVIRPLSSGVVNDLEACGLMLGALLHHIRASRRARIVVSVPLDTTQVERQAVAAVCERITSQAPRRVLDEPVAAAIGSGLPVDQPRASLVVDVGDGITEAVVMSCGGIVTSSSLRVGGSDLDRALETHLRNVHKLAIGELTAERLKIALGAAEDGSSDGHDRGCVEVGGLDRATGRPRRVVCPTEELWKALDDPITSIVTVVRNVLERIPGDLASDLIARGLVLTGGTALLGGLADRLAKETGLEVRLAPDPLRSVLLGNVSFL